MPPISQIVAMTDDRVIGRDGTLPWRLAADLQRFKRLTMGQAILMGRRTYESIGRPLPGRTSIVVSQSIRIADPQVLVARSLDEALGLAGAMPIQEAFVIGGARMFAESLAKSDRIYLTRVRGEICGDVLFPDVDWGEWRVSFEEHHPADARNEYAYTFVDYVRR